MIALIIFAFVIKLILFPLGMKQQKNSVKQAALRPKEMAIRKKYAGRTDKVTQQKLNEEIMALYQSENFNPMAGCLPMLIQLPVLFALYGAIINPIKHIMKIPKEYIKGFEEVAKESGKAVVNQIELINRIIKNPDMFAEQFANFAAEHPELADVFTADKVENLYNQFDFLGINLLEKPGWSWPMILIPIFTFIFAFASTKIIRKFTYQPTTAEGAPNMALMDWTMPLMSVWISFSISGAIGIYWMIQNILGAVQQIILAKMYPIKPITEEEIKQAQLEAKGKGTRKQSAPVSERKPLIEKAPVKRRSQKELDEVSVSRRRIGVTNMAKKLAKSGKKLKARKNLFKK